MKAALALLVLLLQMPEHFVRWTPYDVWALDEIFQGLTIALLSGMAWRYNPAAASAALLFGLARAGCVGLFPFASDASGSVCDSQTGIPWSVGILGAVLFVVGRKF